MTAVVDHQPVGERVGDLAERRLDVPAAREVAVDLVGDAGDRRRRSRPATSVAAVATSRISTTKTGSAPATIVSAFGSCASGAETVRAATLTGYGACRRWRSPASWTPTATRSSAPCAAARGGGDFWAWRDEMIALAESLTVDEIRREYVEVYRELRANGYTAVGEFHYLGLEEARAAAEAADEAGIAFVCLYACYLRGGIPRFRQDVGRRVPAASSRRCAPTASAVGVAPHSVRACPADALRELGRYAAEHELPLHVHADEQPREIEECLAEHGVRPIELLAREGCLGPRTTVVHATHADGHELDLLRDAGARDLRVPDDRGEPRRRLPAGRARLPSRDRPVHRLRLERPHRPARGAARARGDRAPPDRQARRHLASTRCSAFGSDEGAAALGLETWPDAIVDLDHPQLRGVDAGGRLRGLGLRLRGRRAAEDVRPVARPREVRVLGGEAVQAPRAVVGEVAVPRRAGRGGAAGSICVPSCHSLYDVIVTRSACAAIAARHIAS